MRNKVCDAYCDDCYYFKNVYSLELRCCHYILMTGRKRPSDPGEGCTAKVPVAVKRRRKKRA